MGSSHGRAHNGALSATSSSTCEDQPSPRSTIYDPLDNSSFMAGWLMLRPPGKLKARAMWCLVKDGMLHEFKRAESRKPHASRPLEGSLAMPIEERQDSRRQKRGFQLVVGGLYGCQQHETIEYEIVDGHDDDVEKWLNSISASSLLAAIASSGGMPQYAMDVLAVSEEKIVRRERRCRAVVGKSAQSWDSCSVASSALSTASTVSAASHRSSSKSDLLAPARQATRCPSPCTLEQPAAAAHERTLPPPSNVCIAAATHGFDLPPPAEIPAAPPTSVRHFRRRTPAAMRRTHASPHLDCQPQHASHTVAEQCLDHEDGSFDA